MGSGHTGFPWATALPSIPLGKTQREHSGVHVVLGALVCGGSQHAATVLLSAAWTCPDPTK